jgi:2,4-dienoyl-CoA reductase-like NADH-dependent reductase (Old Yellow Enzyme family)
MSLIFIKILKKIAEILNIPVTCIGGIKTYEQVEFILKDSKIQYVAMSRELLKQPDIVKQWYKNKK